jgi:hypothetical protein
MRPASSSESTSPCPDPVALAYTEGASYTIMARVTALLFLVGPGVARLGWLAQALGYRG